MLALLLPFWELRKSAQDVPVTSFACQLIGCDVSPCSKYCFTCLRLRHDIVALPSRSTIDTINTISSSSLSREGKQYLS